MSDPNGLTAATSAYNYQPYQPQVQQQSQTQTPQPGQAPQTPNAVANTVGRSYPYTGAQYQYDPNAQLQSSQAYSQYQQPQTYSQVYQQPYQYQQPQQATQTPTQAPVQPQPPQQQQQPQQTASQTSDYNNAAYQGGIRYTSFGSNPYGYPTNNYMQVPVQGQYTPTSGANLNIGNIRGPLQTGSQPAMIDPNQIPQRPKLTTTFWEDEGAVCYQVESRGISVSRREDTNFINGTKLLNVAGMTRGRRDGILKSEKVRYVVKIGAMNLKGVWIPFERALELARNEGIVDLLYPLFVKDIKELYQGPQYSGGPTAAANNNKTITPVTVTNTTYTPSSYGTAKDKKKAESASAVSAVPSSAPASESDQSQITQQSTQAPASTTSTQPSTATTTGQPPMNYAQYNYQPYPQTTGATGASTITTNTDYKPAYYGYGANPSTPQKPTTEKTTETK